MARCSTPSTSNAGSSGNVRTCARAPPDAKGPPPKLIFKLLLWLHSELRRRIRRSEEVMRTRLWREDIRTFFQEWWPETERRLLELGRVRISDLNGAALIDHRELARSLARDKTFDIFRFIPVIVLPVGDYLAHATAWTGSTVAEALATLRGASPHSVGPLLELDDLVSAIRADDAATRLVASPILASELVDRLCALEGPPVRRHAGGWSAWGSGSPVRANTSAPPGWSSRRRTSAR